MTERNSPLVSAIIVTHNGKKWLARSLPSLLKQTYPNLEVIVVDNASTDGSSEFVRKRFQDVKLVERRVNDGWGAGNNVGARVAKGRYVFIGNDDLVLDRDYFTQTVGVMESDSTIAACQGTMYSFDRRREVESAGKFFNYSGVLVSDLERASPKSKETVEIFAANAPLIRRRVFSEMGGFDEDFFLYFEDVDLCWRIWLAGHKVVYVPQAKMYHKGGATASKMPSAFILYHSIRNRVTSFLKNLGWRRLFFGMLVQLAVTGFGAIVFLFQGKFREFFAICRAWLWNIWHLPRTNAKRFEIQRSRAISDRQLFRRVGMPIPLTYLIGKLGWRRS